MDDYIAMSFPKLPPLISHLQRERIPQMLGKHASEKKANSASQEWASVPFRTVTGKYRYIAYSLCHQWSKE